jgi:hypothetical protein
LPRLPCLDRRFGLDLPRLGQRQQIVSVERAFLQCGAQRFRDFMTPPRAFDNLAPPLQPDQRERRLLRHLSRARQFVIERIQRQ